jgi:hypothetical protein
VWKKARALYIAVRIKRLDNHAVKNERANRKREREDLHMVARIKCLISNAFKNFVASLKLRFKITEKFAH